MSFSEQGTSLESGPATLELNKHVRRNNTSAELPSLLLFGDRKLSLSLVYSYGEKEATTTTIRQPKFTFGVTQNRVSTSTAASDGKLVETLLRAGVPVSPSSSGPKKKPGAFEPRLESEACCDLPGPADIIPGTLLPAWHLFPYSDTEEMTGDYHDGWNSPHHHGCEP